MVIHAKTEPRSGAQSRRLASRDLDEVVAIDAAITGRSRRAYFERRLRAAMAEPALHVQHAVTVGGELAGYVLARRLLGEFGRHEPALRLEVIGVKPGLQGQGIGSALLAGLEADARASGVVQIRTQAAWFDHSMLEFFDHAGFELGRNIVLECPVHAGSLGAAEDASVATQDYRRDTAEVDYGGGAANDFEALSRDAADVRTMRREDLQDIARIDRRLTGIDRSAYLKEAVDEALNDSAVRVSLTARVDGIVAGFVMARTDFGDFGRSEPAAVLDTIGVDPDYAHHHVGSALLSQLFVNLQALRIERVETLVSRDDFGLLGFLYKAGFQPSQRLGFVKRI
ncbi:MAG: GNAT family N-acetyltransferase [Burkholderiales bacterium]|jgi:ribosomal protein S18 acetylase RimI-like enzyme|nr:GNAT family N-acetyltransferase [Burkholderiales bacterium]